MEIVSVQNALAASRLRTANAAAQLHKVMQTAKDLRKSGAFAPVCGSTAIQPQPSGVAFPSMMQMPASGAAVGLQGNQDVHNLATAAHRESAQMQQFAQESELQRMQIAMQMQMAAANELQSREDVMKRQREPSPHKDGRKRRPGEKDTTEYFYDMDKADQRDQEETCVGTTELVKKVKIIQRSSARGYNAWDSYCLSKGNKTKDPRLHHDDFLQGFCDAICRGDFGDVPGAVAVIGENAARKYVPEPAPGDDRNEKPYPKAIFIAGLPKHASEQELAEHFSSFGYVQAVRLKFDADGTFRGIGEVEFNDETSVKRVLENFDYNIFQGRWINCMAAKRKGFQVNNPK